MSVDGRDVSAVPANKRDMGMVFQAYSLFRHLTALDTIAFGLKMRRKSKRERLSRAADMIDLVGLAAAHPQVRGRVVRRPQTSTPTGDGVLVVPVE